MQISKQLPIDVDFSTQVYENALLRVANNATKINVVTFNKLLEPAKEYTVETPEDEKLSELAIVGVLKKTND